MGSDDDQSEPRLGPDDEILINAWNMIAGEIDLAPQVLATAFAAWRLAHLSGSPRKELAALQEHLGDDWRWPWFDEWLQRFATTGRWPESSFWSAFAPEEDEEVAVVPDEKAAKLMRQAKFKLLASAIGTAAYNLHRMAQIESLRKDWPVRRAQVTPDDEGGEWSRIPAEWFNTGESKKLPPYYPGDRSTVGSNVKILGIRNL